MNKIISLNSLQQLVIAPLKKLIDKKADKVNEEDALAILAEMEFIEPIMNSDNSVFTDNNGNLYSL